jgi:hypothetical protein
MRALTIALLLVVGLYGLRQAHFRSHAVFSRATICPQEALEPLALSGDLEKIKQILDQEFTYLGQGGQSIAFGSQDGRYVLKFVKQLERRALDWSECLMPWRWLAGLPPRKQTRLQPIYQSWQLAFERAQATTGLVWLQLGPTGAPWRTTLIDKWGRRHQVALDQLPFLIQRRAESLERKMAGLVRDGDREGLKTTLDQLVALIAEDARLGICDQDLSMRNTGILDGKLVHMDVGTLEALQGPVPDRLHRRIQHWLEMRDQQELVHYLDDCMRAMR